MSILITNAGESIVEEDDILQEVARFYTSLFKSTGDCNVAQEVRRELLKYTTIRVSDVQRARIEGTPTKEEIHKILRKMSKGEIPWSDGMTLEVLLAWWSFLGADYVEMIKHFWSIEFLPRNFRDGVMKVMPKKANK